MNNIQAIIDFLTTKRDTGYTLDDADTTFVINILTTFIDDQKASSEEEQKAADLKVKLSISSYN